MSDGQSDNPGYTCCGPDGCAGCNSWGPNTRDCPDCGQEVCADCFPAHRCPKLGRPGLTLTGVDQWTDVPALLDRFWEPGIEFGILWTEDPAGRGRYPCYRWIREQVHRYPLRTDPVTGKPRRVFALHVCGTKARQMLLRNDTDVGLLLYVNRLQINGDITTDWPAFVDLTAHHRPIQFIIQHNARSSAVTPLNDLPPNVSFLVDSSGGCGVSPPDWTSPTVDRPVGFAGGLGPHNLAAELMRIRRVARPGWWVDMEQRLRVDDRFDTRAVADVITQWKLYGNTQHQPV